MNKTDMIYDIVKSIESKVDTVDKRATSLEIDTSANTVTLVEHMKRSAANEARLLLLENRDTIKYRAKVLMAVISAIATIVGAIYTISKLI